MSTCDFDSETLELSDRTDEYAGLATPPLRRHPGRRLLPSWLPAILQQVDAIARLRNNWDGDGARRPNRVALDSAKALIELLARFGGELPRPSVAPTRAGGVQFSWGNESKYLEVEVNEPVVALVYFLDGPEGVEVEQTFGEDAPQEIVNLARRLA